jgi:hypothetical protein
MAMDQNVGDPFMEVYMMAIKMKNPKLVMG